jgi:DHA1 family tetracycline resistance protein-like MFS transporter
MQGQGGNTTDSGSPTGPRRAAIAFIFVTVVLDMLALGVIIPILPGLVKEFEGGDTADAAAMYGLFGTVFAAMQFLFAPVLGALSDRIGRRPVILLSNFGLGLDYILMALAPSVSWLLVGRVISGICAASFSIPTAYVADVTPPEKRARSFGLIGAAFGLGFIVGPAFGGLLGGINSRLPFWVAAGLSLTNALYGLIILPESLPRNARASFQWRRANPVGALLMLRRYPQVLGIVSVLFLANVAHEALPSLWVLYTDYRYQWGEVTVGLTLAVVGASVALVQGGLVGAVVTRFGERRGLLMGLAFGATGFLFYGLASSGLLFCLGIPFIGLWGFAGPSAQSIMTRQVGPAEQGRLQGALSAMIGVAHMIGPGLFTAVFSRSIERDSGWDMPGAPFFLAAALLASAFVAAWIVARPTPRVVTGEACAAGEDPEISTDTFDEPVGETLA